MSTCKAMQLSVDLVCNMLHFLTTDPYAANNKISESDLCLAKYFFNKK